MRNSWKVVASERVVIASRWTTPHAPAQDGVDACRSRHRAVKASEPGAPLTFAKAALRSKNLVLTGTRRLPSVWATHAGFFVSGDAMADRQSSSRWQQTTRSGCRYAPFRIDHARIGQARGSQDVGGDEVLRGRY